MERNFTKMEPQYSVILYSKYSANCKRLFDLITANSLDVDAIRIQSLCIDNDKIRKRIRENRQIDITSVPCILCIFPNGGVEKYDGAHAFAWMDNIVAKFAPPPPPPPPAHRQQPPPPPPTPSQDEEEEEGEEEIPVPKKKGNQKSRPKSVPRDEVIVPSRMRPVRQDPPETQGTSIDSIPFEDDSDRHKPVRPPRRIRQDDDGSYLEDENLFSGEPVDNREQVRGVRSTAAERKTGGDSTGVRAKMEALARERDAMDREMASPSQRPVGGRSP